MSSGSAEPFKATLTVGTFSGRQIDLGVINAKRDICIVDVAVGLAQQCRYSGQVWPYYSVAEHSVLICQLVGHRPNSDLALKALLHDAPEFLINDLVRPVKRKVTGYEEIEEAVMGAVEEAFCVRYSKEDWATIKRFDDLITVEERRKLMPRLPRETYASGVDESQVPNLNFKCLPPAEAALAFLSNYFFLSSASPTEEERELIQILLKSR